jgi:hypothetical protein
MALRLHNNQNLLMWWAAPEFSLRRRGHSPLLMAFGERGKKQLWSWALPYRPRFLPPVEQPTILLSATCGDYGDAERPTAWLGMRDSNSEMSAQIIPLKGRTDSRKSSRILATETIRV